MYTLRTNFATNNEDIISGEYFPCCTNEPCINFCLTRKPLSDDTNKIYYSEIPNIYEPLFAKTPLRDIHFNSTDRSRLLQRSLVQHGCNFSSGRWETERDLVHCVFSFRAFRVSTLNIVDCTVFSRYRLTLVGIEFIGNAAILK